MTEILCKKDWKRQNFRVYPGTSDARQFFLRPVVSTLSGPQCFGQSWDIPLSQFYKSFDQVINLSEIQIFARLLRARLLTTVRRRHERKQTETCSFRKIGPLISVDKCSLGSGRWKQIKITHSSHLFVVRLESADGCRRSVWPPISRKFRWLGAIPSFEL